MSQGKIKTLIVEDVIIIQRLLKHILGDRAECITETNGQSAVKRFSNEYFNGVPFNLVCLDFFLPEMNGLDILSYIRSFEDEIKLKKEERTKIMMVTSVSTPKTIKQAREMGCDAYIIKPFSIDDVQNELVRLGLVKT